MKILLFLVCTAVGAHAFAQAGICIGESDTIYSHVLGEERTYWVHLPNSYADSARKRYPVIYLLDGDLFFHAMVAVHRSYSGGRQPAMPECIIVGILNTDRTRDLTPSKSAFRRDGKRYAEDREVGGGSELFTAYLGGELRPKVEKKYRAGGGSIIVGHSFGGLFALSVLLRHPELFDVYVALDPSFWWDNGKLVREAAALPEAGQFVGKRLYVGVSGKTSSEAGNIHWQVADDFRYNALPKAAKNGLLPSWRTFPDETHGTVAIVGMTDAFKAILR
ncbi:MAG: alpha/beta hydrolase [Prevotellaceae bacterium]|jgi:predicted alpha/beta superfamily hydrolase|nr:alpha/beta hydrolase [Prevotellaceae bacterium]